MMEGQEIRLVPVEWDEIEVGEQYIVGTAEGKLLWIKKTEWQSRSQQCYRIVYPEPPRPTSADLEWPEGMVEETLYHYQHCDGSTTYGYDPDNDDDSVVRSAADLRQIADNLDKMNWVTE